MRREQVLGDSLGGWEWSEDPGTCSGVRGRRACALRGPQQTAKAVQGHGRGCRGAIKVGETQQLRPERTPL